VLLAMIIVCPLNRVPGLVESHKVSHVMSLLGPEMTPPTLPLPTGCHLRLALHDISEPLEGYTLPEPRHVEKILDFVAGWDRSGPMLIHCYAGISRSTAAAFTAMCALAPRADETELAWELRRHSAVASPNWRMVSIADELLGRDGRMVAAMSAIGRGADAVEGVVFSWPIRTQ
jgi:predicted protein tyrosine phosphatase